MPFSWGADAQTVLTPGASGLVRILGGPGTGKSALLVDAALAQVSAGLAPESVLLLTGSGRLGSGERSTLTTALLRSRSAGPCGAVVREPLVRTVPGYAHAVLGKAAELVGAAPPRLVTSAEQEVIIAELLAGETEHWPTHLHPALGTAGFAAELRALLARCSERGVDPLDVERLGRQHGRPEWAAVVRFAGGYQQAIRTLGVEKAALAGAALDAFATHPELLAGEHARIRLLLVDDAEQLDPQATRLVGLLATGVDLVLIAGDPNQPAAVLAGDSPAVTLTVSQRCAPAVARAVSGMARRLPGGGAELRGVGSDPGSVQVRLAASAPAEAAMIADTLRRAHLIDGVPWSQMAVLVRSVQRVAGYLPRALAQAGVPVAAPAAGGWLAAVPVVRTLLTALTVTGEGLDAQRALALVTGPIGRVDPVELRRLHRMLYRTDTARPDGELGTLLVRALTSQVGLSAPWARPLARVRAVLDAAAQCQREGLDLRYILWAVWQRSALQQRLLTASLGDGPLAVQAGRDLDAVTALFDATDRYVADTAGATLGGFVEHVSELRLRGGSPAGSQVQQVALLNAQSALARDWELVIIAGLQEGVWPNTVPRGGVLATQRLLDLLDGRGADVSPRAQLLIQERQLLVAAMGRARHRLVVTAISGEASDGGGAGDESALPSGFVDEIAALAVSADQPAAAQPALAGPVAAPRVLSAAALVGRLRSVVCAPEGAVEPAARARAAGQLARLAQAGLPGADPAGWRGLAEVSTAEPLRSERDVVTLSPSTVQMLNDCPLRWLVERHGGTSPRDLASTLGSMLHALVAQSSADESELLAELNRQWRRLPFEAQWYSANELARYRAMIEAFVEWRSQTRGELTEVGVEVDVDGVVDADGVAVRLRGRVDRVERDGAGRLVIVDIKTGKSPVSKENAQQHAQLGMYQLAVAEGMLPHADPQDREPGGGRLVYLGRTTAKGVAVREQDPLTPDAHDTWHGLIRRAAAATAGPQFIARQGDGCTHCPARPYCPAHVTSDQAGAE